MVAQSVVAKIRAHADARVASYLAAQPSDAAAAPASPSSSRLYASKLKRRLRRKCHFRAVWAQGLLVVVAVPTAIIVGLITLTSGYYADEAAGHHAATHSRMLDSHSIGEAGEGRHLSTPPNAFTLEEMRSGAILLHIMCMVYMFVGIAIVCDEYFVSSLELISERLEISDDVAGATFMAAGGSAPEFATSLLGVFIFTSDVGFGTIVGSAVFNILFVIGLCAYFSGFDEMQLTWYPLARDSSYYLMCLGVLFGLVSDFEVSWVDALILCLLYVLYVTIMKFDRQIKRFIMNFESKHVRLSQRHSQVHPSPPVHVDPEPCMDSPTVTPAAAATPAAAPAGADYKLAKQQSEASERWKAIGNLQAYELGGLQPEGPGAGAPAAECNPGETSCERRASRQQTLKKWDVTISGAQATSANGAGVKAVDQAQFKRAKRETTDIGQRPRLQSRLSLSQLAQASDTGQQIEAEGEAADADGGATAAAATATAAAEKEGAVDESAEGGGGGGGDDNDDDDNEKDSIWPELPSSEGSKLEVALNWFKFLILAPQLYLYAVTIPDCRVPWLKKYFPLTFTMSIVWVALLTYVMAWMAEELCETMGLPISVAGVTVLAAGTSIPDAISSVLVAREGHGDMALSSSIGSNVFDITFGLPVPWLLYTACVHPGETVPVQSESLPIQVGTLMLMVVIVVVTIHSFGWKISKPMGIAWFVLYFVFLAEAVTLALKCDEWGCEDWM